MAKAKTVGKDGVDAWTSNGYGVTIKKNNQSKAQKEAIKKINESLSKGAKKK